MSPTSYQTAPPRSSILTTASNAVKCRGRIGARRMKRQAGGTVVRIDRRTRSTMAIIVLILVALFILLGILNFAGVIHNPNPPSTLIAIVATAIMAGVAGILSLYRSRVVLHPQGIEVTRFL